MLTKSQPDEVESFLSDASQMRGGHAARVIFPETTEEVAEALAEASKKGTPVTVSGAGTGLVGGRVPFGGIVLATDRLNSINQVRRTDAGGYAVAKAGVRLTDFQRAAGERGLFYPPDPTEWSCFLGGSVATNASGARAFRYGPTRAYIRRLKIALSTGDVLELKRGQLRADEAGELSIPLSSGKSIRTHLASYRMPQTRKHASGYYIEPRMDAIDLFIGSEGTLGVITEIEAILLPLPENILSGVVFFNDEERLLAFVRAARTLSLQAREHYRADDIDAEALEYFDRESLQLLSQKYELVPGAAAGAVFFEQQITSSNEESLMGKWLRLLETHDALLDDSWFATDEHDRHRLREFRHALPVLVNEWLAHHGQRKISTDMAVPDESFQAMLGFYQERLQASNLQHVIFGHIGDNHVHVNMLPRDEAEAARARELYLEFVRRAVSMGGTISAEHGIGKLKRDYLRLLYTDEQLREMAAIKRAFDPSCILGRGNIFTEELL